MSTAVDTVDFKEATDALFDHLSHADLAEKLVGTLQNPELAVRFTSWRL